MIINLKTEYVDIDTGEIRIREEIEKYHYKIINTVHENERRQRFNQEIRRTRHEVEILGKKAEQQSLF